MTLTYLSRSWGSNSTCKFSIIFAYKHDNSINISRIGHKLIPLMYLKSVLVKFEDGWPWPIFQGHDINFNMKVCNFSLWETWLYATMYADVYFTEVLTEEQINSDLAVIFGTHSVQCSQFLWYILCTRSCSVSLLITYAIFFTFSQCLGWNLYV